MRAVFFDLDETILDRSGSLLEFVTWQANGMLQACINNEEDFVKRFIALDQNGSVWKDEVYAALIDEFDIARWSVEDLLNVYLLTFCAFCKPRSGALEAIKAFHSNGFNIGLVTNGKTPFQERNFNALGVSELFGSVIVSEAVGLRKPDAAIFELACRELQAEPSSSIFIGDNAVADIKGAKAVGMKTIHVPRSRNHHVCAEADMTCYDLSELVAYACEQ